MSNPVTPTNNNNSAASSSQDTETRNHPPPSNDTQYLHRKQGQKDSDKKASKQDEDKKSEAKKSPLDLGAHKKIDKEHPEPKMPIEEPADEHGVKKQPEEPSPKPLKPEPFVPGSKLQHADEKIEKKSLPPPFSFLTHSKEKTDKTGEKKSVLSQEQDVKSGKKSNLDDHVKETEDRKKEQNDQNIIVQQQTNAQQDQAIQTIQGIEAVRRVESPQVITSHDVFVKLVESIYSNDQNTHVTLKDGTFIQIHRDVDGSLTIIIKTPAETVKEVIDKNGGTIVETLKGRSNITVNSIRTEMDYSLRPTKRVEGTDKQGGGQGQGGGQPR